MSLDVQPREGALNPVKNFLLDSLVGLLNKSPVGSQKQVIWGWGDCSSGSRSSKNLGTRYYVY